MREFFLKTLSLLLLISVIVISRVATEDYKFKEYILHFFLYKKPNSYILIRLSLTILLLLKIYTENSSAFNDQLGYRLNYNNLNVAGDFCYPSFCTHGSGFLKLSFSIKSQLEYVGGNVGHSS
jgi:hypothetical protein